MTSGDTKPLPLDFKETGACYQVRLADRIVVMSSSSDFISSSFTIDVPAGSAYQVVLTGLDSGFWNVKRVGQKDDFNFNVIPGKNTMSFQALPGKYIVSSGRSYEGVDLK